MASTKYGHAGISTIGKRRTNIGYLILDGSTRHRIKHEFCRRNATFGRQVLRVIRAKQRITKEEKDFETKYDHVSRNYKLQISFGAGYFAVELRFRAPINFGLERRRCFQRRQTCAHWRTSSTVNRINFLYEKNIEINICMDAFVLCRQLLSSYWNFAKQPCADLI